MFVIELYKNNFNLHEIDLPLLTLFILSPPFFWRYNPLVGLGLIIHEVCFSNHTQRRTKAGRTPLDE
jgi:hypothetical protein